MLMQLSQKVINTSILAPVREDFQQLQQRRYKSQGDE